MSPQNPFVIARPFIDSAVARCVEVGGDEEVREVVVVNVTAIR